MANHGGINNFEPYYHLNKFGFLAKNIDGYIYPPFYHEERIQYLKKNWETSEKDIFICTHQKVGTHLTKKYVVELLRQCFSYPEESGIYRGDIGHHTVAWPEVLVSQYGEQAFNAFVAENSNHYKVWYLHNYLDDLPFKSLHPKSKFIHVYRDPRGVLLSQLHFYRSHPLLKVSPKLTLEDFLPLFIEGKLYFGDYFQHTLDWATKAPDTLNIISMTYEDLVDHKERSAKKIFDFICPESSLSENIVRKVVQRTDFISMKQELTEKPQSFHFNTEKFFRSGKSYSWMRELTTTQIRLLQDVIDKRWQQHLPLENNIQ